MEDLDLSDDMYGIFDNRDDVKAIFGCEETAKRVCAFLGEELRVLEIWIDIDTTKRFSW